MDIESTLRQNGIDILPEFNSKFIRNKAQWFKGDSWHHEGREYKAAVFGDFSKDLKVEWKSWGQENLNGSTEHFEQKRKEAKLQEKEEREKHFLENALELRAAWAEIPDNPTLNHPYVLLKKIDKAYGAKIDPETGNFMIPMRDISGELWNVQRILREKLPNGNNKLFMKGCKVEGLFHNLTQNDLENVNKVYLCEGFATGVSIHKAISSNSQVEKYAVIVTFSANNLVKVAKEFKGKQIIVCADNDCLNKDGTPRSDKDNAGLSKAKETGEPFVLPIFKEPKSGHSDFNDLEVMEGLEAVYKCLKEPVPLNQVEPLPQDSATDEPTDQPIPHQFYLKISRPPPVLVRGKIQLPSEKTISDMLLNFYGENIMCEDDNVFIYDESMGHWIEADKRIVAMIHQQINYCSYDALTSVKIKSAYETFKTYMPRIPFGMSFYLPNPFVANFKDKTVLFIRENGKYVPKIKDHDRRDFLTHALPFNFPKFQVHNGALVPDETPLLDTTIANMFKEDDIETLSKKHAFIMELFGNCLAPLFPIIAIFYGKSGTGKSTVIKILNKMLLSKNTSHVKPHEMYSFKLHAMVGKLVNTVLELNTKSPWRDDIMKEAIDRSPTEVDRKFKSTIMAALPAVHVFATNQLPESLDGASGAYGRRAAIIHVTGSPVHDPNLEHADDVWDKESNGIVGHAYLALLKLINQKGAFTRPGSSTELIAEFETNSDPVKQFIEAIKDGEVIAEKDGVIGRLLTLDVNGKIKALDLLRTYINWSKQMGMKTPTNRNKFYRRVRELGFLDTKIHNNVKALSGISEI